MIAGMLILGCVVITAVALGVRRNRRDAIRLDERIKDLGRGGNE